MSKINYQAIYSRNKHDWYRMTEEPQKYEALLAGHYSDSNHFVYELLQNAEDERASKVVIEYYQDRLIFYHNGDPFDEADVCGVSSMLMGTKTKDDASTIGKFGMGFKSVFKYTSQPEIYSDNEGFIIQNYLLPVEIRNGWDFKTAKEELNFPDGNIRLYPFAGCNHLTKIVIPFFKKDIHGVDQPIKGDDVLLKLQGLSGEILMFLTYIRDLYWINRESNQYAHIALKKDETDDHLITCQISGNNLDKGGTLSKYLKYKDVFDHPDMKNAEVSVAYKLNSQGRNINEVEDSPVWVYFPTRDETDLPFLIHGSFETAVSREKLMTPSDFNNDLLDRLGTLIANSLEDLGKRGLVTQAFIRHIVLAAFQNDVRRQTIPGLRDKITAKFKSKPLVPDSNGHCRMAIELSIPVPFSLAEQANSVLWMNSFEGARDFVAFNNDREARFNEYYSWLRNSLGIPVFNLADWAKMLCEQPERKISTTDGTLEELKEFYNFINEFSEMTYFARSSYSRAGYYESTIKDSIREAWEYLREAPIVLNEENKLVPAYRNGVLQIYMFASSQYRTVINSKIVSRLIAKDYERFLSYDLRISAFDNFQYIKEKVVKKYIEGDGDQIGFEDPEDFDKEYIEDLKQILELFNEINDSKRIRIMLAEASIIKIEADDDSAIFTVPSKAYVDRSDEGMDLTIYYQGIFDGTDEEDGDRYFHIDSEYYKKHGILPEQLKTLGLITTPIDEGIKHGNGIGDDYWDALSGFCPNLHIDYLHENFDYIRENSHTDLAKRKSAEILRLMLSIPRKLKGQIRRRQRNPYIKEETANILWHFNCAYWLYDKAGELHSPDELSRYDLDEDVYGNLPFEREAFELLGFIRKESDEKAETFEKVQALDAVDKTVMFRQLARELGYDLGSISRLSEKQNMFTEDEEDDADEVFDPNAWMATEFPQHRVRDREGLLMHVKQQFFFADPVKYEKVMRQIRTSKPAQAVRAYTTGMYLSESDANICQMCKKPSRYVEAVEIANFGIEMPQLHLSLCPNCSRRYKELKNRLKSQFKDEVKQEIQDLYVEDVDDCYEIALDDNITLHFTQTHITEIQEIFNLLDEYGAPGKQKEEPTAVEQKQVHAPKPQGIRTTAVEKERLGREPQRVFIVNNREGKLRTEPVTSIRRPSSGTPHQQESSQKKLPATDLKKGDAVQNAKYGIGTVAEIDYAKGRIDVEFLGIGRKSFQLDTCLSQGYLERIFKEREEPEAVERFDAIDNSSTQTAVEQKATPRDIAELFAQEGFEVIDKRPYGGWLWIVGTYDELKETVHNAWELFRAGGDYRSEGSGATNYRPAWCTRCRR